MDSWKVLTHTQIIFFCFLLGVFTQHSMSQGMVGRWQIKHGIWKGNDIEYADRLIALKLKQGISVSELNAIAGRLSATVINPMNELRWALLEIPEGQDLMRILQSLENDKSVETLEPEGVGHPDSDPNDPFYGLQWGFRNTGQTTPPGTPNADIHLSSARDITQGNGSALLAIFDSGISLVNGSLSHPDLNDVNRIILGQSFTGEPGGVVDVAGHGTHVAGIAGAATNNGIGVAGVAPSAKLLIVKVLDAGGNMLDAWFQSAVIYAVNYASNIHVPLVINLSAGQPTGSGTLADAVQYAASNNALIVASVGNDQYTTQIRYPAAYSTTYSNLIAVGATDQNDYRSYYSNYGAKGLVNIVAPGGAGYFDNRDIYSTIPTYISNEYGTQTNYAYDRGTSMSAPMVSATAALLLSLNGALIPSQLRSSLQLSSDMCQDQELSPDGQHGYGRLNAYQALKYTIEHYSTTIGGAGTTVLLHENFTTLSGTTLTIAPGTTVKMDPGVVLYINGQLVANGSSTDPITLDRTGTSGSWNSLVFQSGSTGTVNYCTFNNASTGVSCYSSNVTINNCTFTNCTGGVTCAYGAAPTINGCSFSSDYFGLYIVGSNPTITYNTIQNCSNSGIYLSGAAPTIQNNTLINNGQSGIWFHSGSSPLNLYHNNISGSSEGFYCDYGSSPYALYGCNAVRASYAQIYANYSCLPDFGDASNSGLNSFDGTPYWYVSANNGSVITAQYNWWGTTSPNSGLFGRDGTSNIVWSPPLSNDPNPGRPKIDIQTPASATGPFADSTFNTAYQVYQNGRYFDAISLFLKVYQASTSSPLLARQALLFLADAYERSGQTDFLTYLTNNVAVKASTIPELALVEREIQAHWLMKGGRYSDAIATYEGITTDFASNAEASKYALFSIGEIYGAYLSDPLDANTSLGDFLNKYPSDRLATVASFIISNAIVLPAPPKQNAAGSNSSPRKTPTGFALESNFPNPFNPSTQISYSLQQSGNVSLVVYDVLGRVVATLANENQQAGHYTLTWNSQSSGIPVSSGMYFARLRVLNELGGVKFVKTIKLLLTK